MTKNLQIDQMTLLKGTSHHWYRYTN